MWMQSEVLYKCGIHLCLLLFYHVSRHFQSLQVDCKGNCVNGWILGLVLNITPHPEDCRHGRGNLSSEITVK